MNITEPNGKKKSVWHKWFKTEQTASVSQSVADNAPEEPSPVIEAEADSAKITLIDSSEQKSIPIVGSDEQEDVLSLADRLAFEQVEKQHLAELAVAEAKRAEVASLQAKNLAELKLMEKRAQALQEESAAAQEQASAALRSLNSVEQAYSQAMRNVEQARAEKDQCVASNEQELSAIAAEHLAKLNEINEDVEELKNILLERRAAAEQALNKENEATARLDDVEADLRRINTEGSDELHDALRRIEDVKTEIEVEEKQLAVFEARLDGEQRNFERVGLSLAESRSKLMNLGHDVEAVRSRESVLRAEIADDAQLLAEAIGEQSGKVEENLVRIRQQLDAHTDALQQAQERERQCKQKFEDNGEQLHLIKVEREESERAAKNKIFQIGTSIEQARDNVLRHKDKYLATQHKVEETTTELVRVNALAKRAREAADQAQIELSDAKAAAEMAQRLKMDATAAKDADDAAFQLLNKAEMVLISTIERTNKLVAEKTTAVEEAESHAQTMREMADQAAAAAQKATAEANDDIVIWLAAEEELVSTTASVEKARAQAEQKLVADLADFDARIAALQTETENAEQLYRQAVADVKEAADMRETSEQALTAIEEQLKELNVAAQRETKMRDNEAAGRLADWQAELSRAEAAYAAAERDCEELEQNYTDATTQYSEKLESYNVEREKMQQSLQSKRDALKQLENDVNLSECDFKSKLSDLRTEAEALQAEINEYRSAAADEAEKIRLAKAAYNDACTALESYRQQSEEEEAVLRAAHEQTLTPLEQNYAVCLGNKNVLAGELNRQRQAAEDAVRNAAISFAERLSAVNLVAVKKIENEISSLREAITQLQEDEQREKVPYDQAEAEYARLTEDIAQLRAEEKQIEDDFAAQHRQIEDEKDAALAKLEQQLNECMEAKASKRATTQNAADSLRELQQKRATLAKAYDDASRNQELVQLNVSERVANLNEDYDRKVAEAAAGLPELLSAAEEAARIAAEAQAETTEKNAAYLHQQEVAERALTAELSAPEQMTVRIEQINQVKQDLLNAAKTKLAAAEGKEAELQAAYDKSCDYAERSERAKDNVDDYLRRLEEEADEEAATAQQEIDKINQRLTALRTDADEKEQKFRAIEKTLINSTELIEAAERSKQDAQIIEAKSMAELQASQAARETAIHLAQQTSVAFSSVDKATAEIMRRASEELFSAADNAELMVAEKQAAYQKAEEKLSQAVRSLDALRQAVGEAPQQLEQSRALWQAAEDDYRRCKLEADVDVPAINGRVAASVAQRKNDLDAARVKAQQCQEETKASAELVEKLSRQLMEAAAEVSAASVEVQTAELAVVEAANQAEAAAEAELEQMRQARTQAEQIAAELEEIYRKAQVKSEQAAALAEEKNKQYTEALHKYNDAYAALTAKYEQERQIAAQEEQKAHDAAQASLDELHRAEQDEQDAVTAYGELSAALTALTAEHDQVKQAYDELLAAKEQAVRAIEEEKLRLSGAKTISRIAVEDQITWIANDRAAKKDKYEAVLKRISETTDALRVAEEKLVQLKEGRDKALGEINRQMADIQ